MSQANPGVLYDATNSWNGYNHQGKIALYYAVEEIIKLLEASRDEKDAEAKLQSSFLEIEWTEDFSIGEIDTSGVKQYHTIHQVKDRQDTELTKYESAIQGLAVNMLGHPEIQKAYLHVTSELSTDPGAKQFHAEVTAYINNLKWLNNQISDLEKNAANKIENLKKKHYTPKTHQAKEQEIVTAKNESIASIERLKTQLQCLAGNSKRVADIEVFKYDLDGTSVYYCAKDKAKELLKNCLENFYRLRYPDVEYKHEKKYINKSYQYLLVQLNDRIVYRAQHRSDEDVNRDILLSELVAWLTTDEIENMGDEFYLYYIKEGYLEYLNDFCIGCKLGQCENCQVPDFKGRFRCMKAKELNDFVHQTNPNVPAAIAIEQYHKFLQQNGIRDPFWNGLRRISQKPEDLQRNNTVNYIGSNNRTYVLTTLATTTSVEDDDDEDMAWNEIAEEMKTICTEIHKNHTKHGIHLDGTILLSKNIEIASVQDGALTISPSDLFRNPNNITTSEGIAIVPVKKFRNTYMRKEHEDV